MALDIRLDYISNIRDTSIWRMTELRKQFIALDEDLKRICDDMGGDGAGLRAISIARTHLETGLQFAIKSLCILGEQK